MQMQDAGEIKRPARGAGWRVSDPRPQQGMEEAEE